jgi:hypothetical protein
MCVSSLMFVAAHAARLLLHVSGLKRFAYAAEAVL